MTPENDPIDPRSLIRDAFLMPELSEPDCRTIFLDWALSLPDGVDTTEAIKTLSQRYERETHPMKSVLAEGMARQLSKTGRTGRRRAAVRRSI